MNIDKYLESYEILNDYHLVTLIDGSKHILNNDPATSVRLKDYINEYFIKTESEEFTGWLGGDYDNLGFYETQKDAGRGMHPDKRLCDLFQNFKGKKVRITIESIN